VELRAKRFDKSGKLSGDVELSAQVFGVTPRRHLLWEAVTAQRARARQGTAKVKEQPEVRGGGKKPYKQKGTGNARQGSIRSPLMPGGGRIFGPRPRDYSYRLSKKAQREALRVALSDKTRDGKILVFEDLRSKEPKTKPMKELLEKLNVTKALFVDVKNDSLAKSVRNLPKAKYAEASEMSLFDVMKYDHLLVSSAALKSMEKVLA